MSIDDKISSNFTKNLFFGKQIHTPEHCVHPLNRYSNAKSVRCREDIQETEKDVWAKATWPFPNGPRNSNDRYILQKMNEIFVFATIFHYFLVLQYFRSLRAGDTDAG